MAQGGGALHMHPCLRTVGDGIGHRVAPLYVLKGHFLIGVEVDLLR